MFCKLQKSEPATRELFQWLLDSIPSERVSDLVPAVPGVQNSFAGVVVHHGVIAVLVCELYVWVPLCSCLGVVSIVNGSGILIVAVD